MNAIGRSHPHLIAAASAVAVEIVDGCLDRIAAGIDDVRVQRQPVVIVGIGADQAVHGVEVRVDVADAVATDGQEAVGAVGHSVDAGDLGAGALEKVDAEQSALSRTMGSQAMST